MLKKSFPLRSPSSAVFGCLDPVEEIDAFFLAAKFSGVAAAGWVERMERGLPTKEKLVDLPGIGLPGIGPNKGLPGIAKDCQRGESHPSCNVMHLVDPKNRHC